MVRSDGGRGSNGGREGDGEGRTCYGVMEGGGAVELTHLGLLLPVSVHWCWCLFMSHDSSFGWWWFVLVCVPSFSSMSSYLHWWAVVFIFWAVMVAGIAIGAVWWYTIGGGIYPP